MLKDTSLQTSPQLALVEQPRVVVALSTKQVISLFKKSEYSHIPFDTLKEVYQRGYSQSLSEQIAYNRVNSFIAGGAAMEIDQDLVEGLKTTGRKDLHGKDSRLHHKELKASGYVSKGSDANYKNSEGTEHSYYHPKSNTMHAFRAKGGKINHAYEWTPNISYGKAHGAVVHEETINEKRGLWDNIHAKRERIKRGSGESMRKPGSKGAPTAAALKNSQTKEEYTGAEKVSKNSDDASSRFVGANSLTDVYKKATPGYTSTVKRVVKEMATRVNEGDVIKTKFATKNMHKRGIEGPHPVVGDDLMRNWALHKMPKKSHDMPDISYHMGTARFHNMEKGTHFDVKGGAPRTTVITKHNNKPTLGLIAPKSPVSFKQDKVKKKKGNVVPIKGKDK